MGNSVDISVLFPAHKINPYLKNAILSILNQSYKSFELLFLDNSLLGIKENYWNIDSRIKHIKLPGTFGLAESLNAGIERASGKYLARMDFDDESLPDRFELQIKFLEKNQAIDILGTGIEIFGEDIDSNSKPGEFLIRPEKPEEILSFLLYKNPLFHPTVMMRTESIKRNNLRYNPKYDAAEDLELWMRASHKVKIANLQAPLLRYRLHKSQFSREDSFNSVYQTNKVRIRHAFWVLIFVRNQRLNASKALIRSIMTFPLNFFKKLSSSKFKKF